MSEISADMLPQDEILNPDNYVGVYSIAKGEDFDNNDNYTIFPDDRTFVVGNGMGRRNGTDIVTQHTCDAVASLLNGITTQEQWDKDITPEKLGELAETIRSKPELAAYKEANTTIVAGKIFFEQGQLIFRHFSVGDSRTYAVHQQEGQLAAEQLSLDTSTAWDIAEAVGYGKSQDQQEQLRNIAKR